MMEKTKNLEITTLPVSAWGEFKKLRLRALQAEPQAFTKSYADASKESDEKWQQRLQDVVDGKALILFARLNGKLVGMAGSDKDRGKEDSIYIWGVYVDKEARGIKAGEELMAKTISYWVNNGFANFGLGVNVDQQAARRMYENLGFKATETELVKEGDGLVHTEIHMKRNNSIINK